MPYRRQLTARTCASKACSGASTNGNVTPRIGPVAKVGYAISTRDGSGAPIGKERPFESDLKVEPFLLAPTARVRRVSAASSQMSADGASYGTPKTPEEEETSLIRRLTPEPSFPQGNGMGKPISTTHRPASVAARPRRAAVSD